MSWLTVIWSMCAAASGMLAAMHLYLWFMDRRKGYYLWSSLACFAAAASAWGELGLMRVASFAGADSILFWQNFSIAALIVSLTWFVWLWFDRGSRGLAVAVTAIWAGALLVNVITPGNLVFSGISSLESHTTIWGESYVIPRGVANPFRFLGDIASVVFLVFVIDASMRSARSGQKNCVRVGAMIVFFIVFAGVHTPLVDAGIIKTPYLIGQFFLAIVGGLSFRLVREAARATAVSEELRRVRGELEHVGRVNLLGELSAALAHEINQPLSAILANAQAGSRFLKAPNPDLDEIRDILEDVANDDKRARDIIKRLRSMLEKGHSAHEPTDLNHSIEEAFAILDPELKNNGVTVEIDLDPKLPPVVADRLGIQQVIVNLLLNAERATTTNGNSDRKVRLRSRSVDHSVLVEVEDNGDGIDPATLPKIFDPFFTTRSDGFGMGLSICRTIVENHGGTIRAENREAGGALFAFSLPVENGADKR